MDTRYITGDDLTELQQKHPAAYQFLLHRSLEHEREALKVELHLTWTEPERKRWIVQRLQDLDWALEPIVPAVPAEENDQEDPHA